MGHCGREGGVTPRVVMSYLRLVLGFINFCDFFEFLHNHSTYEESLISIIRELKILKYSLIELVCLSCFKDSLASHLAFVG